MRIKYGLNPHQSVRLSGSGLQMRELTGTDISLNVMLDTLLSKSIASSESSPLAIYVKHRLPLVVHSEKTPNTTVDNFVERVLQFRNIEFGTIFFNFPVDCKVVESLSKIRFHTIAASSFDSPSIMMINSPELQKINRGIVALEYGVVPEIERVCWSSSEYSIEAGLSSDSSVDENVLLEATANHCWTQPLMFDLALRTLKSARTVTALIMIEDGIPIIRSGFYDGIVAIESVLDEAQTAGFSLSNATLFTDGCFGVRSPIKTLSKFGVRQFVFSGGKSNDVELLDDAQKVGLGAICMKHRYFSLG